MSTSANTTEESKKTPAPKENEKQKAAVDWDEDEDDDEEEQEIGINYGIKPKVTPAPALNIIKASTQQNQALEKSQSTPTTIPAKQDNSKQWQQDSLEPQVIEEDSNEETKSKSTQEERWGKVRDNETPSDATNQSSWGTGERRDNYNKGGKRYQNSRPERPPVVQEIDPNSNFRKYYEKDNSFYQKVLEAEEPGVEGHEFKLQLFKGDDYVENVGEALIAFGSPGFEQDIMVRLMDYDAEQPRSQTHKFGEQFDKHRIMFRIKNKEKAIQFWQDFVMNKSKRIHEGCRHKVYLQKPEELFVKYGDIEAEKYYKEQEEANKRYYEEQQQVLDKKAHGGRSYDQKGDGRRSYKRNDEGGEAEGERSFKGKDRRDKQHFKSNQDDQEENKKLFEELKQGKTSGDSRPTFKNSAKQNNKEEQNTPSVSDEQSLTPVTPIIMPSEPHRKVIDNSKPKRTVTENKPALSKTKSQQYQAKSPMAVGDVTPSEETTSYGVEHVHDGEFKPFAGAVIQEENEQDQQQQQQQPYYPKKSKREGGGGHNRQGGGGRGRGNRQGGDHHDQGYQGEGYQGQERPARGGHSKNQYRGDNQDYSHQEDYGQQDYQDQSYKGGSYKPKQQNQIQNEPRKEGNRPRTAGRGGQGGEGNHQSNRPSKKNQEERKGGEGGEYQPKKSHGAVMGPKAGTNSQKANPAPAQQNQGKKQSQNLFAFFES